MTFTSLQNKNPFVLPLLFLFVTYLLRRHLLSRQKNARTAVGYSSLLTNSPQQQPLTQRVTRQCVELPSWTLRVHELLVLVALLGTLVFEVYFHVFECTVSSAYYDDNRALVREVLTLLHAHQLHAWLDYATLLNHVRQSPATKWDHDSDLSMIHPAFNAKMNRLETFQVADAKQIERFNQQAKHKKIDAHAPTLSTKVNSEADLQAIFEKAGYQTTYTYSRDLLQVWSRTAAPVGAELHVNRTPHVDLWMWMPSIEDDRAVYEKAESNRKEEVAAAVAQTRATTDTSLETELEAYAHDDASQANREIFDPDLMELGKVKLDDGSAPPNEASKAALRWHSADHAIHYNGRMNVELFPLRLSEWSAIGADVPVWVPNDEKMISEKEFSHYGGSYLQSQVFRGDCFHNLFNARWAY